jgi:hypothetical protein
MPLQVSISLPLFYKESFFRIQLPCLHRCVQFNFNVSPSTMKVKSHICTSSECMYSLELGFLGSDFRASCLLGGYSIHRTAFLCFTYFFWRASWFCQGIVSNWVPPISCVAGTTGVYPHFIYWIEVSLSDFLLLGVASNYNPSDLCLRSEGWTIGIRGVNHCTQLQLYFWIWDMSHSVFIKVVKESYECDQVFG